MQIRIIPPNHQLRRYINQLWVLSCSAGVPEADGRIVVPNGTGSVLLPIVGSLEFVGAHKRHILKQGHTFISGIWDEPKTICSQSKNLLVLGVDINPIGISRIFPLPVHQFTNNILSLEYILRNNQKLIGYEFPVMRDLGVAVHSIQDTLCRLLRAEESRHRIIDCCIERIVSASGKIGVNELVEKSGYTKRYLAMLFKELIGVSPKVYAEIIRFNQFYDAWAKAKEQDFYSDMLYEYYYDQSHFIKEFKKFTGYSPLALSRAGNAYGKLFYNDFPFLQSYGLRE